MFSSYQKQALTVIISPLCTDCHDITVILLNVALNTIHLSLYLQRHTYLPIYLHFYQNYRFYSIFASYFPILMSFKFPQSNLFYITAWYSVLFLEQGFSIYLPTKGKQISVYKFKYIYFPTKSRYLSVYKCNTRFPNILFLIHVRIV